MLEPGDLLYLEVSAELFVFEFFPGLFEVGLFQVTKCARNVWIECLFLLGGIVKIEVLFAIAV